MKGTITRASLTAAFYGVMVDGLIGGLTGFVVAVGAGSGVAIIFAEPFTGVAGGGAMRRAQQVGGLVASAGCLAGGYYGGWRFGWMWGAAGYLAGMFVGCLVAAATGVFSQQPRQTSLSAPEDTSHSPPTEFNLDDPKVVLKLALQGSIDIAVYFAVWALVGSWLSHAWLPLGKVAFWLLVTIVALDAVRVGLLSAVGVVVLGMAAWQRRTPPDEPWLTLGTLAGVIEVAVGIAATGYLGFSVGSLTGP